MNNLYAIRLGKFAPNQEQTKTIKLLNKYKDIEGCVYSVKLPFGYFLRITFL